MNNNISVGLTNYCCNFVINKFKDFRKGIRCCNTLEGLRRIAIDITCFRIDMHISFDFFNLPINKIILDKELDKVSQSLRNKYEKIKENNKKS